MRHRLLVAMLFSVFSILPIPIALTVISGGDIVGAFRFVVRHDEMILAYFIFPAIAVFISSYALGGEIRYNSNKKDNNFFGCMLFYSMLIVYLALVIWGPSVYLVAQDHEKWFGIQMALLGTTILSWAVYPPGLLAGYVVWRLTKT